MNDQGVMANQVANVISIRRRKSLSKDEKEVVERAFALWLERFGEQYGSPKDDFLKAREEMRARTEDPSERSAALFVVPKRHS